jgi:hypothetical protein
MRSAIKKLIPNLVAVGFENRRFPRPYKRQRMDESGGKQMNKIASLLFIILVGVAIDAYTKKAGKFYTALGFTQADSRFGPTSLVSSWIRTGGGSSPSGAVGVANCSAWTSDSGFDSRSVRRKME